MRIISSPAKKMRENPDGFDVQALPEFLTETEKLLKVLRSMNREQLQKLWKCSDQIAEANVERIRHMDLRSRLTPALVAYEGIQYRYMAPEVFTDRELDYIQEHLRILSGFYGVLRPQDGVVPYRLEMQAALRADGAKDLYAFWGDRLARHLAAQTDCIINLASAEYSQCISRHLPGNVRFITCVFGERQGKRVVEKGTLCKMARGEMVRFMAENRISRPEELRAFNGQNHRYSPADSTDDRYVFVRGEGT